MGFLKEGETTEDPFFLKLLSGNRRREGDSFLSSFLNGARSNASSDRADVFPTLGNSKVFFSTEAEAANLEITKNKKITTILQNVDAESQIRL